MEVDTDQTIQPVESEPAKKLHFESMSLCPVTSSAHSLLQYSIDSAAKRHEAHRFQSLPPVLLPQAPPCAQANRLYPRKGKELREEDLLWGEREGCRISVHSSLGRRARLGLCHGDQAGMRLCRMGSRDLGSEREGQRSKPFPHSQSFTKSLSQCCVIEEDLWRHLRYRHLLGGRGLLLVLWRRVLHWERSICMSRPRVLMV